MTDYSRPRSGAQARGRPLRRHQPAGRRADPRGGAAGRRASAAALQPRHAQRAEGHDPARGAARGRATGAEYDAWLIDIMEGQQFGSGFVDINPNSKIPALVDRSGRRAGAGVRKRRDPALPGREVRRLPGRQPDGDAELAVLADGLGAAAGRRLRALLRLCAGEDRICDRPLHDGGEAAADVLDQRLAESEFVAGADYSIADMAIWPWYGSAWR
jgi:hypothetical protein